jgi:hypothetical protein
MNPELFEIERPNIEQLNPSIIPLQTAPFPENIPIDSPLILNPPFDRIEKSMRMSLGVGYNLFDGEELLESSIRSIRESVDYIVVVYQTVSNFGNPCSAELVPTLEDLLKRGLINELVHYQPRIFTPAEKREIVSQYTYVVPGGRAELVSDQFVNESVKREIGRLKALDSGCTHFMTMDSDEYYIREELERAKQIIWDNRYEGSYCKMRFFFKKPIYEMLPLEENNYVPFIYELHPNRKFAVGHYSIVTTDPTRNMRNTRKVRVFERNEVEMYHMSFVRKDIRKKITNTSNRNNHAIGEEFEKFVRDFNEWTPDRELIHSHSYFKNHFKTVRIVENQFNIPMNF